MKKKTIALLLVLMMVFGVTCGGTIAYLTSTASITNTFTVGNVTITLDETKVDVYGVALTDAAGKTSTTNTGNAYKLIPGHEYTKDPTIHVQPGSEKCYVFVKVENGIADIEAGTKIADQIKAKNWIPLAGVENVYYKTQEAVAENGNAEDLKIFDTFKLSADADVEKYATELDDVTGAVKADAKNLISVTAYAVQFDGFEENIAGAWDAVKDL